MLKLGNNDDQQKQLVCYVDADWGGDVKDRKSNTGFTFSYLGALIIWTSHKQSMITLSSTEAEYIDLAEAVQEGLWIQRLLSI